MTWRTRCALAAALLAAPGALAAQYRGARSADYLFGVDAWGARALWVNPAALGSVHEASVMGELVIGRIPTTDDFGLTQFTVGFNSRGFSGGYRRDRFGDSTAGNVWRVGFGRGLPNLVVGMAMSIYSDSSNRRGYDVGIRYRLARPLEVALGLENISQPVVRDSALRFTAAGSAGWSPLGGLLHVVAEARATDLAQGGWEMAYRAGLRITTPGRMTPIVLHAVLDLDDNLTGRRLVFGVAVGGDYQGVLLGSGVRNAGNERVEAISLTGVASQRFP